MTPAAEAATRDTPACGQLHSRIPAEAASSDPDVLRAALIREATERRRSECLAGMQREIVQFDSALKPSPKRR